MNFDLGLDVFGFSTGFATDSASATFTKTTLVNDVLAQAPFTYASVGSCVVITSKASETVNLNPLPTTGLDAGAQITAAAMTITKTLMPAQKGYYTEQSPVARLTDPVLDTEYKVTNGTGGTDVGAFDIDVAVLRQTFCGSTGLCAPPALTWTNEGQITTVQRSAGVTVNWTGGDPVARFRLWALRRAVAIHLPVPSSARRRTRLRAARSRFQPVSCCSYRLRRRLARPLFRADS
jgi:hypothetical protein